MRSLTIRIKVAYTIHVRRQFAAEPIILTQKRKIAHVDGADEPPLSVKHFKPTPKSRKKKVTHLRCEVYLPVNQPVAGLGAASLVDSPPHIVEAENRFERKRLILFPLKSMLRKVIGNAEISMHEDIITGHQSSSPRPPDTVLVRLYESADGWRWNKELTVSQCENGDLDLKEARIALGLHGDCDVSIGSEFN